MRIKNVDVIEGCVLEAAWERLDDIMARGSLTDYERGQVWGIAYVLAMMTTLGDSSFERVREMAATRRVPRAPGYISGRR